MVAVRKAATPGPSPVQCSFRVDLGYPNEPGYLVYIHYITDAGKRQSVVSPYPRRYSPFDWRIPGWILPERVAARYRRDGESWH